jgi:hypothetical protein
MFSNMVNSGGCHIRSLYVMAKMTLAFILQPHLVFFRFLLSFFALRRVAVYCDVEDAHFRWRVMMEELTCVK